MSIFGGLFNRGVEEDKLEKQREKLEAVHESLKIASSEIEDFKNQLVKRANGSLYPHLADAGVKLKGS